uniref:Uncharacterized protein n=1 Tax=Acrobeloides nanus TaxID=290746 RepID=A0A914D0A3_9BILA
MTLSSLSTSTTACQPTLVYTLQNGPSTSRQPSGTSITYDQNTGPINGVYIVQDGLTTPYDPMLGQYVSNPANSESFILESGEMLPPTSSNSLTEYLLQNSTTEYLLKLSETNEASNSSYPSDMEIQEHAIDVNAVPNDYIVIDEGRNFQYEIAFLKQENERLDAERETAYAHAKEMAQQLEKALEEVRKLKKENNNLKEAAMKNYRVIQIEQAAKKVIVEVKSYI